MAKFTIVIDAPNCDDTYLMLETLKGAIHTECNLDEYSPLEDAKVKTIINEDYELGEEL